MRGKVYRLFNKGRRLEPLAEVLVGEGDFNLNEGAHPVSGKFEKQAFLTQPKKGVVARLSRAEVITVAGFGMSVVGLESIQIGGSVVDVQQEWWFIPVGHEE